MNKVTKSKRSDLWRVVAIVCVSIILVALWKLMMKQEDQWAAEYRKESGNLYCFEPIYEDYPSGFDFMDPFCLGVYNIDTSINQAQFDRYIEYLAALESGNAELAKAKAAELLANLPSATPAP